MYGYVEGASKPLAFPVVGFAAFWVPHCSFMASSSNLLKINRFLLLHSKNMYYFCGDLNKTN
ncbi:MAG: hypothetical protein Q3X12_01360, partial [Hallella sp.]|nr:hypothetical protein [Hallella sp.]